MSVQVPPGGKGLTLRQAEVLSVIEAFVRNHGFSPTVRELGALIGTKSPNGVISVLNAIERKGHLSRDRNKSRSLRLTVSPPEPGPGRREEALELLALATCGHLPPGTEIRVCFRQTGVSVSWTHHDRKFNVGPEIGALDPKIGTVLKYIQEAAEQARMMATAELTQGNKQS